MTALLHEVGLFILQDEKNSTETDDCKKYIIDEEYASCHL
jgi:hypothetical protein